MSQKKGSSIEVCRRCAKPLQRTVCLACGGKGYYRVWLFFRRDCEACSASGSVLRCPNEFQHIREDLKLPHSYTAASLYKSFRYGTVPRTPLGAKGAARIPSASRYSPKVPRSVPPQVPPPWHPSYPNPWHPAHPQNPMNQPFHPMNPNSPSNPNNPMNPMNPNNPMNR